MAQGSEDSIPAEGERGELRCAQRAKHSQRRLGLESRTNRGHFGEGPGEVFGKQTDDDRQNVMGKTNLALRLGPAHRARKLDQIETWRIGCRAQARGLFGGDDDSLELVERPCQIGTAASSSDMQSRCE